MVGRDLKFIFIQAPKTGTSSIQQWLIENDQVDLEYSDMFQKHIRVNTWERILSPQKFNHAFKFMFVRNPWDRLVSDYHYLNLLASDPSSECSRDAHTIAAKSLFIDYKITDFTDFVNFITDHSEEYHMFPVGYLKINTLTKFATRQPYGNNGKVIVDHIGRFENLQSDFDEICEKLDIPGSTLPHINSTKRQKDWRSYYTDDTFLKVAEFYIDDIVRFGYEHPDI